MSTDTAACAYINGTVKSRLSKDKVTSHIQTVNQIKWCYFQ